MGGVAPYEAFGPGWTDGMGESNVTEFGAAAAGRDELETLLGGIDRSDVTARPAAGRRSAASSRRSTSTRGAPASATTTWRARVKAPGAAPTAGATTTSRSWRRGASSRTTIDVPVAVWHGEQDRAVPFAHGRWLCDHLPATA